MLHPLSSPVPCYPGLPPLPNLVEVVPIRHDRPACPGGSGRRDLQGAGRGGSGGRATPPLLSLAVVIVTVWRRGVVEFGEVVVGLHPIGFAVWHDEDDRLPVHLRRVWVHCFR